MDSQSSRVGLYRASDRVFYGPVRTAAIAPDMQRVDKLDRWLHAHSAAQTFDLDPTTAVDALTRVLRGAPWEVKELYAAFKQTTIASIENPLVGEQIKHENPMLWKQLNDAAKYHNLGSMSLPSQGSFEQSLSIHGSPSEGRFIVQHKENDSHREIGGERTVGVHRTYAAAIADMGDRAQPSLTKMRQFEMER